MIEEVLLVSGASGTGKTTVGWEVSHLLRAAGVAHWHLDGDVLDSAWPRPSDDADGQALTRASLRALADVFVAAGYTRCVYVQTAALMDLEVVRSGLGDAHVVGVLLTASAATRRARLADREIGGALDQHVASSDRMTRLLDERAPAWTHRVVTDDRTATDLAHEALAATGWLDDRR